MKLSKCCCSCWKTSLSSVLSEEVLLWAECPLTNDFFVPTHLSLSLQHPSAARQHISFPPVDELCCCVQSQDGGQQHASLCKTLVSSHGYSDEWRSQKKGREASGQIIVIFPLQTEKRCQLGKGSHRCLNDCCFQWRKGPLVLCGCMMNADEFPHQCMLHSVNHEGYHNVDIFLIGNKMQKTKKVAHLNELHYHPRSISKHFRFKLYLQSNKPMSDKDDVLSFFFF